MADDSTAEAPLDPRVLPDRRHNAPPQAPPPPFSPEKGDILGITPPPLSFPSKSPFKNLRDGKK